jgi:iron complex outermembrane receptor protein
MPSLKTIPQNASISGSLLNEQGKPMDFATVTLLRAKIRR